jgi:hypothetical protein
MSADIGRLAQTIGHAGFLEIVPARCGDGYEAAEYKATRWLFDRHDHAWRHLSLARRMMC